MRWWELFIKSKEMNSFVLVYRWQGSLCEFECWSIFCCIWGESFPFRKVSTLLIIAFHKTSVASCNRWSYPLSVIWAVFVLPVCVHMFGSVYVCIHMYVFPHVCIYVCVYVCIYVPCIFLCLCVLRCVLMYLHACMCISVVLCVHVRVCLFGD